jgi:ubiquinol-cytochrome c reductase cytochrome b subunit
LGGRRALAWMTGVVCFLASLRTVFIGYLVQTNFDSQWISFEAKDGLNAVGIGAFFNVANWDRCFWSMRVCWLWS